MPTTANTRQPTTTAETRETLRGRQGIYGLLGSFRLCPDEVQGVTAEHEHWRRENYTWRED